MSLTGPPRINSISRASIVLDGGRTRLQVEVAGWGRLTIKYSGADGRAEHWRKRFFGKRLYFLDALPPCELTIEVSNLFGADSVSISLAADVAGIGLIPLPIVRALLPTVQPLPNVKPLRILWSSWRTPSPPKITTPQVLLSRISIKDFGGV